MELEVWGYGADKSIHCTSGRADAHPARAGSKPADPGIIRCMALLLATPDRDPAELARALTEQAPDLDIRIWPDLGDPQDIEFALVWRAPEGLYEQLPALRAVSSLGAGVEAILDDPSLPGHLQVGRLAGPRLAANMAAYLVAMVVHRWKRLGDFATWQQQRRWRQWAPESPPRVGILGMGAMGRVSAAAFGALDIPVVGWSRSGAGPEGVRMCHGPQGLAEIARISDHLICLLPLTAKTRGILNAELLARMHERATLINVGRGGHLDEQALIRALDLGRPAHAILDVFQTEPLPADHPFWAHPRITITPHCASITLTLEAAKLAVESYRSVITGHPPLGLVDRSRCY